MSENQKSFPFAVSLALQPPLHLKTVELQLTLARGESLEEYADMIECLCDLSGLGAFAETPSLLKESRALLLKKKKNERTNLGSNYKVHARPCRFLSSAFANAGAVPSFH